MTQDIEMALVDLLEKIASISALRILDDDEAAIHICGSAHWGPRKPGPAKPKNRTSHTVNQPHQFGSVPDSEDQGLARDWLGGEMFRSMSTVDRARGRSGAGDEGRKRGDLRDDAIENVKKVVDTGTSSWILGQ
jgi:hypothetical protein